MEITVNSGSEDRDRMHLNYLPTYASFLLAHYLEEFAMELLRLCREEKVPLLRYFQSYT
jgi:hypothetical protein